MIRVKKYSFTLSEYVYLFLWTFYSVFYFICSASELQYSFNSGEVLKYVTYLTIVLLILAVIFLGKYSLKKTLCYFAFLAVVFLIELSVTDRTFLIYILFIILAQEINFDKLLRWDIILKIALFITIVGLCLAGITENYSAVINGNYKQAYGFTHPNEFTCFALTILIEYLCIRYKKMKWFEWILILLSWAVVFSLGGGRTISYTFLMIFALFIVATAVPKVFYTKGVKACFIVITPILAVLSFVFAWLYSQGNAAAIAINSVFTSRFSSAARFIETYGIKLFGQEVTFVSTRQSQLTGEARQILDNAYVNSAIRWGLIFFVLVVVLYSYLFWKLLKNHRVDLALMGLFFVILGFGELYMMTVFYNLTFLCLLGIKGIGDTEKSMSGTGMLWKRKIIV